MDIFLQNGVQINPMETFLRISTPRIKRPLVKKIGVLVGFLGGVIICSINTFFAGYSINTCVGKFLALVAGCSILVLQRHMLRLLFLDDESAQDRCVLIG